MLLAILFIVQRYAKALIVDYSEFNKFGAVKLYTSGDNRNDIWRHRSRDIELANLRSEKNMMSQSLDCTVI